MTPARRGCSGEHTRLACWLRRLAATFFLCEVRDPESFRGRQHARRVRYPDYLASGAV